MDIVCAFSKHDPDMYVMYVMFLSPDSTRLFALECAGIIVLRPQSGNFRGLIVYTTPHVRRTGR
jgi:hypothetical protein